MLRLLCLAAGLTSAALGRELDACGEMDLPLWGGFGDEVLSLAQTSVSVSVGAKAGALTAGTNVSGRLLDPEDAPAAAPPGSAAAQRQAEPQPPTGAPLAAAARSAAGLHVEELQTHEFLKPVRPESPGDRAAALRAELAADEQLFEEAATLAEEPVARKESLADAEALNGTDSASLWQAEAHVEQANTAARWGMPRMRRFLQDDAQAMGGQAPLGLLAASLLAAAAVSATSLVCAWGRRLDEGAALRRRVEKVQLVSGGTVEKLFGLAPDAPLFGGARAATEDAEVGLADCSAGSCPGVLLRIRGRVVSGHERALVAPISGRPCAVYSASVSPQRQDGVHPQPVAHHSEGTDFLIEIADAPYLRVKVHHQDTKLFSMVGGHVSCEQPFSEASDSRVDFVLSHLTPGPEMSGGMLNRASAGIDGTLEFKESALLIGSYVTAVGELCRDKDGSLQLYPWRPPPCTTRRSFGKKAAAAAPVRDLLAGRVLASDDPSLLDPLPGLMQCMFG